MTDITAPVTIQQTSVTAPVAVGQVGPAGPPGPASTDFVDTHKFSLDANGVLILEEL